LSVEESNLQDFIENGHIKIV